MANLCAIIVMVLVCTLWATKVQSMPQNIGVITTTPEPSTWDKIKKGAERGWQVVYDETHCAFHKVSIWFFYCKCCVNIGTTGQRIGKSTRP